MSLNKPQLKQDLNLLYDGTIGSEGDAEAAKVEFIDRLADAIEAYVKSAEIKYINGLTAGANPVVGTFNGNLQ